MDSRDFRISRQTRSKTNIQDSLFSTDKNFNSYYQQAQDISYKYNNLKERELPILTASNVNASAILHYIYQNIIDKYLLETSNKLFSNLGKVIESESDAQETLTFYSKEFPSPKLSSQEPSIDKFIVETSRAYFVHKVMCFNPAMIKAIKPLIAPNGVVFPKKEQALQDLLGGMENKGVNNNSIYDDLFTFLITPALLNPDSLFEQIKFILKNWQDYLTEDLKNTLLKSIDYYKEETKPVYSNNNGGNTETYIPQYNCESVEIEAFTKDRNWMPNVIMVAKSTLVWLDQLSKYYQRPITTLDKIPNEELDKLRDGGFTALWLIGLWERSDASKKIKNLCGNPEAEASAYSLKSNMISQAIGGWEALENLKNRCSERGIKLAADMVPNHVGLDADWVVNHPEYFIKQSYPPFPCYTYNGEDLSKDPNIEIKIEDHYYDKTDAAVTFRRVDKRSGETTYIFHGNDGTSMPWNDTAQLDFLNPITREAVFQQIRHIAINFPIIRFDAAMTLAKKHIQRLWYPKPGCGGDIAGRTQASLTQNEFDLRIPKEFWREVVDRMAEELPDTLLLAEAFWMMEGYFVRTLGMHRVYNSAFMNMLKNEENFKYKEAIKATLKFEPEILKRYVNFMSNPDEETAFEQFGDGDKYFGVCSLLTTMPGLPMFGHGQIEGLKEKYGMEYKKAYWDEWPSQWLIDEHKKKIFPLMKKRYIFSEVENFQLYDLIENNHVNETVFCYSNEGYNEKAIVFYNNQYNRASGYIKHSAPKLNKGNGTLDTTTIAKSLKLSRDNNKFVIYKNFNDGLTYLMPSNKIINEGFFVDLNGFETKVFMDIREITDNDGSYRTLYNELESKGVKDIELAIKAIRLKPIHNNFKLLAADDFLENLYKILNKKGDIKDIRKVILEVSQMYINLDESLNLISNYTKKEIGEIREVKPKYLLENFNTFSQLLNKYELLSNAALIIEECDIIASSVLFSIPFITTEFSFSEIIKRQETLLLPYFYSKQLEKKGLFDANAIHSIQCGAVILSSHNMVEDCEIESFSKLLEDKAIQDFILCNTYKDITYYKKESLQELIILSAISLKLFKDIDLDIDDYISRLMKAETKSEYQIKLFLEEIKTK